ncbi:UDP-glycosyltransferase 79B3-like [Lotus japonicus]|uniref:UDP-glycosyltransferase 79B3-like n=1 Tax=Lotus japonicus TaxID=34305 RepID=UPI00258744C1|nr:UDP-glycosyltransferase 79B3-like [Lotus japonicus]
MAPVASKNTSSSNSKLHIAMFPWFAMGHMTPYVHLANELAKRGHKITFLLPNKARLALHHLNRYPNLITFHIITVPNVDGLPLGTETASEIPLSLNHLLVVAMDKTRNQVEQVMKSTKPHFVLFDVAYWVPEAAKKLGIKTICYHVVSAMSMAMSFVPAKIIPKDRPLTVEDMSQPPPGYPSSSNSKLVLRRYEAEQQMFASIPFGEGGVTLYDRTTTGLRECDAIAIKTTTEVEGCFCDYIAIQYHKNVLLTGPVLSEEAEGEELEERWAKWLDGLGLGLGLGLGPVVYCAFGSQVILGKAQFQEILLGLEISGFPFLVALKAPEGCATVDEALPEGFEERVKGRGMVSRGWVPRSLILKHGSVGCFVSHCGHGSMWESLIFDKQMVVVPHMADQVMNSKLVVDELEVAVAVERGEDDGWVSKEGLSEAIKSVMEEGSELGARLKNNQATWKERGWCPKVLNGYIDRFVQELHQELPSKVIN